MRFQDSIRLKDGWQGWFCDFSDGIPYKESGEAEVFGFDLPMDTRHLLFSAGKCGDPRVGTNSRQSDWVVTKEWWFRTRFSIPTLLGGERVFMRTQRVDYLAEYFVNGRHVGSSESFNQVDYFDITDALAESDGDHELAVRLWAIPPGAVNWELFEKHEELSAAELRNLIRFDDTMHKARMFWGGDHNAFMMSCGIAEPPEIIIARDMLVRSMRVDYTFTDQNRPERPEPSVSGEFLFELDAWGEPADYKIELKPANFDGKPFTFSGEWSGRNRREAIAFSNLPLERWFQFQQGFPHCYELSVTVGGNTAYVITGFRTIERRHNAAFVASPAASVLDWHPYENNEKFGLEYYKGYDAIREAGEKWPEKPRQGDYRYTHLLNGREFYVMGGSIVPPTLLLADWRPDLFRRLIRRARESNNNTLRVWGGGYLCGEDFFEEADLQGVMISEDFLNFAAFKHKNLSQMFKQEKELRSVVRQLNPHPSVVVFNGGNELLQGMNKLDDPIFETMQRVMRQETANQLFHRSSPVNPETHGPWHFNLDHPARYNSYRTIFCSECGVTGCPSMKSLWRTLSKEQLDDVFGPAWQHRQPDPGYFHSLMQMAELFGPVERASAAEVVERTQLVQAMGYQYLVEEFRRNKPVNSGFTTWEFNEPWIDFNWGIIDTHLVPKHSFWAFKRSCAQTLLSARFRSYVYAPGERFTAEIFFSVEGNETESVEAEATAYDAEGNAIRQGTLHGSTDSDSVKLGEISFPAPDDGVFFLKLTGGLASGGRIDNDYTFFVLPGGAPKPMKALFISGGAYEDTATLEFFKAAGFAVDCRTASPIQPLDMQSIDMRKYDVVVLGAVFNPLRSLGGQFFRVLKAAVERGLGFVYLAYNTSAHTSGRYDADDLRSTLLEELLPVRFANDFYRNSEEGKTSRGLSKVHDHPIWNYISMNQAPPLGYGVRFAEKEDGGDVIGLENEEPVLATWKFGRGIVTAFAGPYAGGNYPGIAFRSWPYAQRLLENIVEYSATGAIAPRLFDPHVFGSLYAVAPCNPTVEIELVYASEKRCEWEATIKNAEQTPVLFFNLRNDSDLEGETFDWSVSDNRFCLFMGESKRITATATAHPGKKLPPELRVLWSAWNG